MRLLVALLLPALAAAQNWGPVWDRLVRQSPAARQAHWGVHIVDLATGRVIFERNAAQTFVPASNTKLFTTALALARLGPDHRFRTRVLAASAPDREGVIRGDLILEGGGDPNVSGRTLPYLAGERRGERALGVVEKLADEVAARGVVRVTGDVVGDDSRYRHEPFPEGWAIDDAAWEYGAPVSALSIADSTIRVRVAPGSLLIEPALEHLVIHNLTRAGAKTEIALSRIPLSRELTISGEVREPEEFLLAVDDPALFAAAALRDALLRRGVRVEGGSRARHDAPASEAATVLAAHESRPLQDALQVINKVSQNLHAEMVLREVGYVRGGEGSLAAGLRQMAEFLKGAGVPEREVELHDGSGLSRLNLISPRAATTLLRYMYSGPHREAWLAQMPIGGVDGTLEKRFSKAARARLVHAKTGTVSHVSTLSGYLLPERGRRYAFAILANGYAGPVNEIRGVVDRFLLAILRPGR